MTKAPCAAIIALREFPRQTGAPIAYHRLDDFLSCLGCVTGNRKLAAHFFGRELAGTCHQFYPHRRASRARSSNHFRQAHLKFSSLGVAKWPHLPQTNRPSATAAIGLNSSPETQQAHPATVIVKVIFTAHICLSQSSATVNS